MIRLVCQESPLIGATVRVFLQKIGFVPRTPREMVAMAFLYPSNHRYRRGLHSLSLMERLSEVQILGFASKWRVRRWLHWLAMAAAPLLDSKKVCIAHAYRLSEVTQLFFAILSNYVPEGNIQLIYGHQDDVKSCECYEIECSEDGERELIAMIRKIGTPELTEDDKRELIEYARLCMLTANMWQADHIYNAFLSEKSSPSIHHSLAQVYRFFDQTGRAEWHYRKALKNPDPILKAYACYSLAVLYLRHHPKSLQSNDTAADFLRIGKAALENYKGSREAYMYARLTLSAATGLLLYRQKRYKEAKKTMNDALASLETLPDSERKTFCRVHALNNVAQLERALNNLERSVELNKQAVELDPYNPLWPVEYGKSLMDLHRYDEAVSELEKVAAQHYDYGPLHALIAQAYEKCGMRTRAADAWAKASRYSPQNADYRKKAADMQTEVALITKISGR